LLIGIGIGALPNARHSAAALALLTVLNAPGSCSRALSHIRRALRKLAARVGSDTNALRPES
jgi:hypothetical protein